MVKILELFSGTESFSKVARERGHEVFTVDFDKEMSKKLYTWQEVKEFINNVSDSMEKELEEKVKGVE